MKYTKKRSKQDESRIMVIIRALPPEYVRKIKIYAETLLEIFKGKMR